MTRTEIELELKSIGRPELQLGSLKAIELSRQALESWKNLHPASEERHRELVAKLSEMDRSQMEGERAARIHQRGLSLLMRSGAGQRSITATDAIEECDAMKAAREWMSTGGGTLLLAGSPGTGKTVAATWCVREVCQGGEVGYFRRATEIARLSSFDSGAEEIDRLRDCALLVVDDLGSENMTGHARGLLFEILDHRHESYLRTVITTNLKRAEIREKLGDRLIDRVIQAGKAVWLEGVSKRRLSVAP